VAPKTKESTPKKHNYKKLRATILATKNHKKIKRCKGNELNYFADYFIIS